ncbi:hypothetical protein QTP86_008941 [Hemibagrus guttatus]|nr:hypothetical protein QTP86_008941 [Hemibagrus guttatus]
MAVVVNLGLDRSGLTWQVQAKHRNSHESIKHKIFLGRHRKRFADNLARSYKYTALTFLPRNLYEQFQRAANLFFLLVVIMQCIPAIATLSWYIIMLPLITVLTIRGAKDLFTDLGRRRSDAKINKRHCDILTTQGFTAAQWKDVCVGDILRIYRDQVIPIVLSMMITALLLAVGCALFEHLVSPNIEVLSAIGGNFQAAYWGFLTFWGYIVLLSPAMPISLYITRFGTKFEGFPHYQAASPDEQALVCAARELGWVFLSRTRDSLTVSELGITRQYNLLALLEFTSKRRRMSVLVRTPEGAIKLYCKGADTVVLKRSQKSTLHEESTAHSLEVFAQSCLRTFCVAVRLVGETQWMEWSRVLQQGAMATTCQESMLEELHDQMERELMILGVAAIEDRLQEGVPETIVSLRRAGVKVWVLTGDKTETAVSVGYACKLVDPDTKLFQGKELSDILHSPCPELCFSKRKVSYVWSTHTTSQWSKAAIVVDGFELEELIKTPELGARFVSLCNQCQSVLCCRVTPGQKAEIVELVKKFASSVTMAIGDGANDVNMIKMAHIGVGIRGVEDGQAVQNADFALAQFRFLTRLLLVHGQWSYHRICSFLSYFLYKTTSFALVNIWFSFYNGFSAQHMYESWFISLYSILYTSLPVQCLGFFEQNMSAESCLQWPEFYTVGQRQELFNPLTICVTLLYSIYTSVVLFFLPFGVFQGSDTDYHTLAVTVEMSAVLSVTVEIILQTKYWTKYNFAAVFVSLVLFFLSTIILHSPRLFTGSPKDYSFFGILFLLICQNINIHADVV